MRESANQPTRAAAGQARIPSSRDPRALRDELPGQCEGGAENDEVQRHEQVRFRVADRHRNTSRCGREGEQRNGPGYADEQNRKRGGDRDPDDRARGQGRAVPRGSEHGNEERGSDRPQPEPREPSRARASEDDESQAGGRQRAADARELLGHPDEPSSTVT